MVIKKKLGAAIFFSVILATGLFWFNPGRAVKEGMIILTAVPSEADFGSGNFGIDGKYIPGTRILAVDPGNPEKGMLWLSEGFNSARSPEVSYDGRRMVFSAQQHDGDPWQIYIKDLETLSLMQVTDGADPCTDPVWLPDGRIGFSRLQEEDRVGRVHVFYACNTDGSGMERLTFHPGSDIASTVTLDGRLIMCSTQEYPDAGAEKLLAMRVDGTKSGLYYQSNNGSYPVSRPWETPDRKIYFVEGNQDNPGSGKLVSLDHGHPLSSWKDLSVNESGFFHSVYPLSAEQLIVSYRANDQVAFGLYVFDVGSRKITTSKVYVDPDHHLIEPVAVAPRQVPMKLPQSVDDDAGRGTLLCHNADLSMNDAAVSDGVAQKAFKVRVIGMDGPLGEVELEKDGSFYIEVDADRPVRFVTLNENGEILRGPSDWIWVRSKEKRSCIGCHEDRELAPENRVPDALYNGMVSLPEGKKAEPVVLTEKYVGK